MTTLDPRGLEAAARVKCRQDEELMLLSDWGDLDGDQQDALRGEVSEIITAYLDALLPPSDENVPHMIRQAREVLERGRRDMELLKQSIVQVPANPCAEEQS